MLKKIFSVKQEKGGSPTSSRSDVTKCRATAQGVGAVVDKLTTEPGECHCGSHKGCEATLLRVVSKLVFLKPCNFLSPTSILAVFRCNRDDLIGCVHPKGILPKHSWGTTPKQQKHWPRACSTASVAAALQLHLWRSQLAKILRGMSMAVSKTGEPHVEAQHIETSCVCPSIKRCFSLASENMVVTPESRNMASSGHIKATLNLCDSNTFKSPSGHVNNPEANRMWNIYLYICYPIWVGCVSFFVMQFPKADLNHLTVSIRKQVVGLSFKSTITTIAIMQLKLPLIQNFKYLIASCHNVFFWWSSPLLLADIRTYPLAAEPKKTGFDHSCWQAKHVPSSLWFWNNSNHISAV